MKAGDPKMGELHGEAEMKPMLGKQMWAGEFGDAYTDRNQVRWLDRVMLWKVVLQATQARSVFEMGCNAGWNLSAIKRLYPDVVTVGSDVNKRALAQAREAGLNVVETLDFTNDVPGKFELTFTAGVLIHIEPEYLEEVMRALIAKSRRYVVAIEYEADEDTQVMYRGQPEKCWKRPYGKHYEKLGLKLIDSGWAGSGFDFCTCWVMEK
jgi:pseudaminic acid biosynthesis-associated methylase